MAAQLRNYLKDVIGLGPNQEGTNRANAIMDEGINTVDDLAEAYDNDGIKTLCSNVRKPGGTIPDPTFVAPRRNAVAPRVARLGQSIPTICEQRLTYAAYGAKCYNLIGRNVEEANLGRVRLQEFKKHLNLIDSHTDPDTIDDVTKTFTVMKFLDQFPTYLRDLHGVSNVSLSYVIRKEREPPNPLPALTLTKPWGEGFSSVMEEQIRCVGLVGPDYDEDNARVYNILTKALSGTSAIASITRFQRKRDGRGAYEDLVSHNMGSAKWEKMVELAEDVLTKRTWNGKNSRYPLKIHISRHREAFNDLERASHQITYAAPNETSRVRYLLNSIISTDATICSAKTLILSDAAKKDDFETAADFLLIVAPKPRNEGSSHRISALKHRNTKRGKQRGKIRTGPKTGVEIRFFTKPEWAELSQDERNECIEIRTADNNKRRHGSADESDKPKKISKIEQLEAKINEQTQQISALLKHSEANTSAKSTPQLPPQPSSKNPLKPPNGFNQRE